MILPLNLENIFRLLIGFWRGLKIIFRGGDMGMVKIIVILP